MTTLCRCWRLTRADGLVLGGTDHDQPLTLTDLTYQPDHGMTAGVLSEGTGLSVDNSEAQGALSHDGITDADIEAGRWDGAQIEVFEVDWTTPDQVTLRFRGNLGEIRRGEGRFEVELRGLTDPLNHPRGRVYQSRCDAILGEARCGVDLDDPAFTVTTEVRERPGQEVVVLDELASYAQHWFSHGRMKFVTGAAAGLEGLIKADALVDGTRRITLWTPPRAELAVGDNVRLIAGCNKRGWTCRTKFSNYINFQGFPDIPGADWQTAIPALVAGNRGGSRR